MQYLLNIDNCIDINGFIMKIINHDMEIKTFQPKVFMK